MALTILVVDDDLGIRVAVGDYLETLGYGVTAVSNARSALDAIPKLHPHLLIVDIAMPGLSGYDLVRQVRSDASMRLLPVIFLTALNGLANRIEGYQVGCDAYLAKPFELEELEAIVRNLLDRNQLVMDWRGMAATAELDRAHPNLALQKSGKPAIDLGLTTREQEVIRLLSEGLSNPQIGERLHLSARTIEKYVSSLFRKTDTKNRAELLRYTLDHQLF